MSRAEAKTLASLLGMLLFFLLSTAANSSAGAEDKRSGTKAAYGEPHTLRNGLRLDYPDFSFVLDGREEQAAPPYTLTFRFRATRGDLSVPVKAANGATPDASGSFQFAGKRFSVLVHQGAVKVEREERPEEGGMLRSIATKIEAMKDRYPHLAHFDSRTAVVGSSIDYRNHIETRPNPSYEADLRKQKEALRKHPELKQQPVSKTLESYPPEDGIWLRVDILSADDPQAKLSAAVRPRPDKGEKALVDVRGADTPAIAEIRGAVSRFAAEMEREK